MTGCYQSACFYLQHFKHPFPVVATVLKWLTLYAAITYYRASITKSVGLTCHIYLRFPFLSPNSVSLTSVTRQMTNLFTLPIKQLSFSSAAISTIGFSQLMGLQLSHQGYFLLGPHTSLPADHDTFTSTSFGQR